VNCEEEILLLDEFGSKIWEIFVHLSIIPRREETPNANSKYLCIGDKYGLVTSAK
jgi:hypothetical protein